jgi:hypothetical protein
MDLRVTDTNSANDSKGRAFGLEGNDFIYVLVAFVAGLGFYLLLTALLHVVQWLALSFALPILLGTLTWVLVFRRNKPDGYVEDWFDQLVNPEGWSFVPGTQSFGKGHHEQPRT